MNCRTTSVLRKVLLGAISLACIFASAAPSNDAEACPPRRAPPPAQAQPPQSLPWPIPTTWPPLPLPATLPHLPLPQLPWVVPAPAPQPQNDGWPEAWSRFEDQTLVLTNERRARGAVCGDEAFAPAPPLAMNVALRRAAREHSDDMGERNYFSHASLDGRSPTDRIKAAGWSGGGYTGENIFAGPSTPEEAVDGWMKSPGHCKNMMSPAYKQIGIGYADVRGSSYERYWTQDFGG